MQPIEIVPTSSGGGKTIVSPIFSGCFMGQSFNQVLLIMLISGSKMKRMR